MIFLACDKLKINIQYFNFNNSTSSCSTKNVARDTLLVAVVSTVKLELTPDVDRTLTCASTVALIISSSNLCVCELLKE